MTVSKLSPCFNSTFYVVHRFSKNRQNISVSDDTFDLIFDVVLTIGDFTSYFLTSKFKLFKCFFNKKARGKIFSCPSS